MIGDNIKYDRGGDLLQGLRERVVVLDGAMGTMIQQQGLGEEEFRGSRFAGWERQLKGCNDVLVLTRPDVIADIHRAYLDAGADIIETNSFNANAVSLADYGLEGLVAEINRSAARLARSVADEWSSANGGRRRWVAGSVGPTNRSLSISPSVEDPAARSIAWNELVATYMCQMTALIEGGVDVLLVETFFDTLNAKAALWAAREAMAATGVVLPVMVSATLTESGRTLSGQTLEAFWASIAHAQPACVCLNCGFGAEGMLEWVARLSEISPVPVGAYPNAGLPNEMGEYDETPELMARHIKPFVDGRLVNMVGGCCGSTPEHIRAIVEVTAAGATRQLPGVESHLCLSGLEAVDVVPERNFINIGERCNVAGSRKFLRLISEGNYDEALSIARKQVENGAQIIDVNMDDAMLDAAKEMTHFLRLVASDPDVARVPVMIDSSKWEVIEAGLKELQGKGIVNSISLKDGVDNFLARASFIKRMGAAMVVMAFDERGQADTFERRTEICARAYKLLTEEAGVAPTDIIFDPNVLAIATGIEQHNDYAADFLRTVEWVKANLPGAKVSGGVSNLSFSFRGNNYVREAMHSVFLYHAIARGLDMAIVNAAAMVPYEEIPTQLRDTIEDVIFNRTADATDRLIALAAEIKERQLGNGAGKTELTGEDEASLTAEQRLERMIVRGSTDGMEAVVEAAKAEVGTAMGVIDGALMRGMDTVGDLFGKGKMFLPQVVKSARAMKQAVAWLNPYIEAERSTGVGGKAGRMVIATVKGDVHDIGKNIVSIVMRCNGFEVIDLGVMVPGEEIVKVAIERNADIVALSGLITPSLDEMCRVARLMEQRGLHVPLMVGGATTSELHTAVKIAPEYGGAVVHTRDAASMPVVAQRLLAADSAGYEGNLKQRQAELRRQYEAAKDLLPLAEARRRRCKLDFAPVAPAHMGITDIDMTIADVEEYINWKPLLTAWQLVDKVPTNNNSDCEMCQASAEAARLLDDARNALELLKREAAGSMKVRIGLWQAFSDGDDIVIDGGRARIATLRQQHIDSGGDCTLALADFVAPRESGIADYIGTFAVTVGERVEQIIEQYRNDGDDYQSLLLRTVADRLAEAATELMHRLVCQRYWGVGLKPDGKRMGIRPAVGYPSLADQSLIFEINRLMSLADVGITLTENGAMHPAASTCGLIMPHPGSHYFIVGAIGDDQRRDYAARRGYSIEELSKWLRQ